MKLRYLFVSLLGILMLSLFMQSTAFAQGASSLECSNQKFLTFPAWYRGIVEGSECTIVNPADVGGIGNFIWIIGLNLVEIILNAVGYAAVFFIIYGGYKYMTSAGSAEGISSAKKTIMNAVVGLVISIAAVAIVNTVVGTFNGGNATPPDCSQGQAC